MEQNIQNFGEFCERIRQQSINETNTPFIILIQNGIASSTQISKKSLNFSKNKTEFLGQEVELLIHVTKIKGD